MLETKQNQCWSSQRSLSDGGERYELNNHPNCYFQPRQLSGGNEAKAKAMKWRELKGGVASTIRGLISEASLEM